MTTPPDLPDVFEVFAPGTLINGRYRIERVLGRGGFGAVFLADETILERHVAIKVVAATDPELSTLLRERFVQEARAMASLQHEHVVRIHNIGSERGHPYLVMEYIDGQNLKTLFRNQPLPVEVTASVLDQIAAGVAAVHAKGLVHRDVKAENILIGPDYRAYLTDFGLAHRLRWSDSFIAGTPIYMAPEVIERVEVAPEQRHLCDVYALGVLAFGLLTGRAPYPMSEDRELLKRKLLEPPASIADVAPELAVFAPVIAGALARDLDERTPTAESFRKQLADAAATHQRANHHERRLRILVVDDDADMRTLYQVVFESAFLDATLRCAEDGLVAFELTRALRPDLMILDLQMPRLDGLALCRMLREARIRVPIVVVSGRFTDEVQSRLRALGVRRFVAKPIDHRELVGIAKQVVDQAALRRTLEPIGTSNAPAPPDDPTPGPVTIDVDSKMFADLVHTGDTGAQPLDTDVALATAYDHLSCKRFAEAEALISSVLADEPQHERANVCRMIVRARQCEAAQDDAGALIWYRNALEFDPSNHQAREALGELAEPGQRKHKPRG